MPIDILVGGNSKRIVPSSVWQKIELESGEFKIDQNYYVLAKDLN